jgi:hypothetical protein
VSVLDDRAADPATVIPTLSETVRAPALVDPSPHDGADDVGARLMIRAIRPSTCTLWRPFGGSVHGER